MLIIPVVVVIDCFVVVVIIDIFVNLNKINSILILEEMIIRDADNYNNKNNNNYYYTAVLV